MKKSSRFPSGEGKKADIQWKEQENMANLTIEAFSRKAGRGKKLYVLVPIDK